MGFLINVELHFRTRAKSPGDDPTLRWINREDWVQAPPAGRPMGRLTVKKRFLSLYRSFIIGNRLALFLLPIKGTKGGQVRSQPRGLFTERLSYHPKQASDKK